MKTILSWYQKYEKALTGFAEWMVATDRRLAAFVFLFLFGMGLACAVQPYQAIARGGSWTDTRAFVGKNEITYSTVWQQAIPAALFLVASLFIPGYYLLKDVKWINALFDRLLKVRRPAWLAIRRTKPKPNAKKYRRPKTKARTEAAWNWAGYSFAALAYLSLVLYPLWFFVTKIRHGLRWDSQVHIYPSLHGPAVPVVVVGAYCLFMLFGTLDTYLRYHHKSSLAIATLSLLTHDIRRKQGL